MFRLALSGATNYQKSFDEIRAYGAVVGVKVNFLDFP